MNGPAASAQFFLPMGIKVHPITQEVYIADHNNGAIRGLNLTSQTVRTVYSLSNVEELAFYSDGTLLVVSSDWGVVKFSPTGLKSKKKEKS